MQFEGHRLDLEFDDTTGNLTGVKVRADDRWLFRASGVDTVHLSVNGTVAPNLLPDPPSTARPQDWFWVPMALPREEPQPADLPPGPFRYVSSEAVDVGSALEVRVHQAAETWEVVQIYRLDHARPFLEVDLEIAYVGPGEHRLNYVAWRTAGWSLADADDDPIDAMGRPVQHVSLADGGSLGLWRTGDGEHHEWEIERSRHREGVIGGWIYAAGGGWGWCAWCRWNQGCPACTGGFGNEWDSGGT